MALSIKTAEADRLARELSSLTGETMTETVTVALRERLERVRPGHRTPEEIELRTQKILELAADIRSRLADTSPMTKVDWDALWDDDPRGEGQEPARGAARR